MIKVDKNNSSFKGTLEELATEVAVVLKEFRELSIENLGEEAGNNFCEDVIKVAKMSKEQIDEEAKRARRNILFKLLGIED